MNEMLIAFLKFVSSSALLLLFYWLLLRGKSSYSACRIYLLSIPLVSLLASSVTLEVYQPEPVIVEMAEPHADDAVTSVVTALPQSGVEVQTAAQETFLHTVSAEQVLIFSILLVSLVLILVPLINIVRLMVLCRKLDCSTTTDGYRLIHSPSVKTPFSFGATIFLPANMGEEEERVILLHEKAHIRHRHYIDVWTLEFLVRLLWFNPVLWLLRKEIRSIHEFEADRDVVDSGINVVSYQTLLLESVLDDSSVLANGFNHSFVRRRFVEMRKKVVATTSTVAKVSTVAWILIVLCGFTFTTGEAETIYKASEVAYVPKSTSVATDEDDSRMKTFKQGIFKFHVLDYDSKSVSVSFAGTDSTDAIVHNSILVIPGNVTYGDETYTVTEISRSGFAGYGFWEEIVIPESVTKIGDGAFMGCMYLRKISIPAHVNSIGSSIVVNCPNLECVIVDKNNKTYDSRDNCNAIIETGSDALIAGCYATKIPNSVVEIGDNAFLGCSEMTTVHIPNSVRSIGFRSFANCFRIKELSLSDSLHFIHGEAFDGCSSLEEVNIPRNAGVLYNPFTRCSSLRKITVDKENKIHDSRDGCNAIIETESGRLLSACSETEIPPSVKSIEFFAFCGLLQMTDIRIPASVLDVRNGAIVECPCLTNIEVDKKNPKYYVKDGCLIDKDTKTLVCGSAFSNIPYDVTSIADYAFRGMSSAKSIVIPSNVEKIGMFAFYGCNSVKSLYIPSSVKHIGQQAFSSCKALRQVEFEEGVELIPSHLFSRCSNLEKVEVPLSVNRIGQGAFHECNSLASVLIPESLTNIEEGAFPKSTQVLKYK